MEVAGTSIAIVNLLSQVIVLGRALVEDIRNQEFDAATLATRMSVALDRVEALQNLFFNSPVAPNGRPVFEHLRRRNQINVTTMFEQYHYLIHVRYRAFREAYQIAAPMEKNIATSEKQNKWQLPWLFGGKKRFQTLVESCEKLNEQLYEILELYILEKSFLERNQSPPSPPSLDQLRRDSNAQYLQLDTQVEMIRISSGEDTNIETAQGNMVNLEVQQHVTFVGATSSSSRRVATYLGRTVLVEFKKFFPRGQDYHEGTMPQPSDVAMKRINQLAVLLNRPQENRSRLLHCAGFYCSSEHLAYAFIFDLPPGRTMKPMTLLEVIIRDWDKSKHNKSEPNVPLEIRLNLALTLAVSVFQFHTRDWVHKSLRSDNVLIFPENETKDIHKSLEEPWVAGFEYAREETDVSDTPLDATFNVEKDIYKHPQRLGVPTTRFGKLHDIYSLGVILLEIGLWQPVATLESSGFRKLERDERTQIQSFLLKKAAQKLPFKVGTAYAQIVEKCLSGNFETETAEGAIREELYRDQIIGVLRHLTASAKTQPPDFP